MGHGAASCRYSTADITAQWPTMLALLVLVLPRAITDGMTRCRNLLAAEDGQPPRAVLVLGPAVGLLLARGGGGLVAAHARHVVGIVDVPGLLAQEVTSSVEIKGAPIYVSNENP